MPENATEPGTALIVHPATGEVLDLKAAASNDLGYAYEDVIELEHKLRSFRQAIADEAARRLDSINARTETFGDVTLETNAPTEESYSVDDLLRELKPLVAAELLDESVLERCVIRPLPNPPAPKVDKREVNKLKRHDSAQVLAALARARVVTRTTRTLKVKRASR